ncbi:sulfatase family protein [Sphingobacterium suaedae]|uniref:Sulfatase n=1 Tax=Sphingobacterium suaedae TaxID=1686402 RepID=A0ABW5KI81_9SPHI
MKDDALLTREKMTAFLWKPRLSLFCLLVLLFCFSKALFSQDNLATKRKPNMIIIMADDLDSRQLSCYGGQNMTTKHIDRLAREGLRFTNLIASEAMCVPTRGSLFTGLYPVKHGAYQNHKPVYPQVKSIVHYLNDVGYRVGLTGKDHMTIPKFVFPFEIIPGFEKNCVSTTDVYFLDSIAQFVQQDDSPYCLFVMSINPHAPWTVGDTSAFDRAKLALPNHWVDTEITRRQFVRYLAEVRQLDNQVGQVLKMLEDNQQLDHTVVIFLGEQGPQFPGGKWTLYDNGQRSSMLIRWPSVVKGGVTTSALVQFEDIAPTLVEIAGGYPISGLDGQSFMSLLDGEHAAFRKYAYGIHNNIPEGPAYPIRSIRSERFKLILNLRADALYHIKYMTDIRNKKQAYTSWVEKGESDAYAHFLANRIVKRPPLEFYDLQRDPNELFNLAADPHYQTTIEGMRNELFRWMEEQGDSGIALDVPFEKAL